MYKYVDYLNTYGRIMQFNKNKQEPFHRWYPFVEGYSKEFIQSIIEEIGSVDLTCLEPFSGSGTTALELQNIGVKCISFEVNPLMYLIGKVKLENTYTIDDTKKWFEFIMENREKCKITELQSEFSTLYEGEKKKKWNFDKVSGLAVKKLQITINTISSEKYKHLFTVALASILLDASNLYRNGKCLSYKKDWENRPIDEKLVFNKFDDKIKHEIIKDIESFQINSELNTVSKINNIHFLYNEDCRNAINTKVDDNSIDLVITSPPYLNSRDYTDTYMLELKTLGFTKSAEEIRELRKKTLRSHVQIKWDDTATVDNKKLQRTLDKLNKASLNENVWNKSIIDMVRLYFVDMYQLFSELYLKMRNGGKIYFNVSNSAYFNVLIDTLELCASIAEQIGFNVIEIRKARYLNTSPQQQKAVGKLLEGVLILERRD
ncbi:MAG: site-specific DNA-methyltransferase [Clostridia bacterium]|nr:site-specific DNA-methyltransferase [Clostridia bacterium]